MTKKKAVKKSQNRISGAAFTAPILVLFVMILLLAGEFYVKRATSSGENVLLSICIVQGIAFLAPTLLYYQLKHRKLSTSIFVSPVKISHGVFIIFANAVLLGVPSITICTSKQSSSPIYSFIIGHSILFSIIF
jgi:hypothetical protein